MTSSSELLALAVRCEHEGPSRELDAAIERAVHGMRANQIYPPPRTSSIDSAVTLVPKTSPNLKEVGWHISSSNNACVFWSPTAENEFEGTGSVPALALCAAALRARSAAYAEAWKEET